MAPSAPGPAYSSVISGVAPNGVEKRKGVTQGDGKGRPGLVEVEVIGVAGVVLAGRARVERERRGDPHGVLAAAEDEGRGGLAAEADADQRLGILTNGEARDAEPDQGGHDDVGRDREVHVRARADIEHREALVVEVVLAGVEEAHAEADLAAEAQTIAEQEVGESADAEATRGELLEVSVVADAEVDHRAQLATDRPAIGVRVGLPRP